MSALRLGKPSDSKNVIHEIKTNPNPHKLSTIVTFRRRMLISHPMIISATTAVRFQLAIVIMTCMVFPPGVDLFQGLNLLQRVCNGLALLPLGDCRSYILMDTAANRIRQRNEESDDVAKGGHQRVKGAKGQ